nr:aminoglycoside phosphotransferase family protein [Petrachloros mirabilis]
MVSEVGLAEKSRLDLAAMVKDRLTAIATQFSESGQVTQVEPLGNGNINDTFLVTLAPPSPDRFVLQRINTQVFQHPVRMMQNMRVLGEHIHQQLHQSPLATRRWEVPQIRRSCTGADYWVDAQGSYWRAIGYIEAAESLETLQTPTHAQEVGYALGLFHRLLSNLPSTQLADTLPGFHITPSYLDHYEQVLATGALRGTPEEKFCLQFVCDRAPWVTVLETAKAQGKLPLRPIHGDPKVNNVMLDTTTGQAVAMVDLDTVKPGLIHYDIGDCLRSGCNPLGEETLAWESVSFELDLAAAILRGYIDQAQGFLTAADYAYTYDAIRLIAFELGLRFLSDYLAGNVYFKVNHPDHNLARALVQFKLTESIEAQEHGLRAMIQDLR